MKYTWLPSICIIFVMMSTLRVAHTSPRLTQCNSTMRSIETKTTQESKPMVVVIPSYKNAIWYQQNLDSVVNQDYPNFRVIYTDDYSPDNTGELVAQYIRTRHLESKISLTRNQTRRGALANIYTMVHSCADDEIIVNLDGDDWFAHPGVLSHLNAVYQDSTKGPGAWITYGQYVKFPFMNEGGSRQVPHEVIANNSIRSYDWVTSHLRTYYAWLFKKINCDDLIWHDDVFYPAAWDNAFMLPMIEMAGFHSRFIPEILYVYNLANPINDHIANLQLVDTCYNLIRGKPAYQPLDPITLDQYQLMVPPTEPIEDTPTQQDAV